MPCAKVMLYHSSGWVQGPTSLTLLRISDKKILWQAVDLIQGRIPKSGKIFSSFVIGEFGNSINM
jgi:hypothetical protein